MSHTNSTANLSLPQFIGSDKPTWLGDVNGAFSAIDSYAGTNDAAVAAAASDATSAISQASAAVSTANTANTTAGNASTVANNAIGVANNAVAIAGTVDAKVGLLADLNTTDRTSIVNAINEVNGKDAGDIAYDNTGSGLTATNIQDAIDEVAQGGGGGNAGFDVLWTNANPSASMGATTVALTHSVADYDEIEFVFRRLNTGVMLINVFSAVDMNETNAANGIGSFISADSSYVTQRLRDITITSATPTSASIADEETKAYNGSGSTENTWLVPVEIRGYRR